MAPPCWPSATTRFVFLISYENQFLAVKDSPTGKAEFFKSLLHTYGQKYHYTLRDNEDPNEGEVYNAPKDAKEVTVKMEVEKKQAERIKRWFYNRYIVPHQGPKRAKTAFPALPTPRNLAPRAPKKLAPLQTYIKLFHNRHKAEIDTLYWAARDANPLNKISRMTYVMQVCASALANASEEDLEAVQARAMEVKDEGEESLHGLLNGNSEQLIDAYLDGLPEYLDKLVKTLNEMTGWTFLIVGGGLSPSDEGLSMYRTSHINKTSTSFEEYAAVMLHTQFDPQYKSWLKQVYGLSPADDAAELREEDITPNKRSPSVVAPRSSRPAIPADSAPMAAIIQPVRLGENRASLVAKELIAPPPASTAPNRVLVSTPTASLEEILPVSPECSPVVYDLPLDMSALLSSAETEGTNQEEVVTNDNSESFLPARGSPPVMIDTSQKVLPTRKRKTKEQVSSDPSPEVTSSKRQRIPTARSEGRDPDMLLGLVVSAPLLYRKQDCDLPDWLKKYLPLLDTKDFGTPFAKMIRLFKDKELSASRDKINQKTMPAQYRPSEIARWITDKRTLSFDPQIADSVVFGENWWRWWRGIHLDWRVLNQSQIPGRKVRPGAEVRLHHGANGTISAIVALVWWGRTLNTRSKKSFESAVQDVTWVLNAK